LHCGRTPALATPVCRQQALDIGELAGSKGHPQDRAYRHVTDFLHLMPQKPLLALHWEHTPVRRHRRTVALHCMNVNICIVLQLTLVCFKAMPTMSPMKARNSMNHMLNSATCMGKVTGT
jgi:hypothetical protein